MSMATRTDPQSPTRHVADSHDLIRVHGARENNLKDVSLEIPKRRRTVFTGVSGSGKSSLVFDTIAAESQRMINETYSAVQGFMPTLARPDVDVLDGLTTAILVDQERMGSNPRSTVGTATDANAMLRILFSRLEAHIGPPTRLLVQRPEADGERGHERGQGPGGATRGAQRRLPRRHVPALRGHGLGHRLRPDCALRRRKSLAEGALTVPGYSMDGWYGRIFSGSGFFDMDKPIRRFTKKELRPPLRGADEDQGRGHQPHLRGPDPEDPRSRCSRRTRRRCSRTSSVRGAGHHLHDLPRLRRHRLSEEARSAKIGGKNIADLCAMQISDLADWVRDLAEPSVIPRC